MIQVDETPATFNVIKQLQILPDYLKYEKKSGHILTPYFNLQKQ